MTNEEDFVGEAWNTLSDLEDAANLALRNASERKVRLFLVACGGLLPKPQHERIRVAFEVAARYADEQATLEELSETEKRLEQAQVPGAFLALNAISPSLYPAEDDGDGWTSFCAGGSSSDFGIWNLLDVVGRNNLSVIGKIAEILADLIGPPLSHREDSPRWFKENIQALARSMYQERRFDRMEQLADAFVDAGCDDARILAHCRGPRGHVQGCWVIDRILGLDPQWG